MQEQLDEKISLLIDDELDSKQALSLLAAIQKDELLKDKLHRYQLIGLALKNKECYLRDSQFVDKIHQEIRKEPTFFFPAKKSRINLQKAGFAVAASIALAVVWIANKMDKQANIYPDPQIASTAPVTGQSDAMVARFGDYLQAHDNDVYFSNTLRAQPDSQVVGYRQE